MSTTYDFVIRLQAETTIAEHVGVIRIIDDNDGVNPLEDIKIRGKFVEVFTNLVSFETAARFDPGNVSIDVGDFI